MSLKVWFARGGVILWFLKKNCLHQDPWSNSKLNIFGQSTIYQLWWSLGPNFRFLSPKLWEEFALKGIKWWLLYKRYRRSKDWYSRKFCKWLGPLISRLPLTLEHWVNFRGGNIIQKYCYTPNFSLQWTIRSRDVGFFYRILTTFLALAQERCTVLMRVILGSQGF